MTININETEDFLYVKKRWNIVRENMYFTKWMKTWGIFKDVKK